MRFAPCSARAGRAPSAAASCAVATTLGLVVVIGALPVLTGVITAIRVAAGLEAPFRILGLAATAALEFGLFLLAYTVLTPGRLGWRTHLPGALVMTAGWELFKLAGGLLIEYYLTRATLLYGTIGAIVALLLFLRLGSDLFLIAAELSAALSETGAGRRDRTPGGPRPAESDSTAGAGGAILAAWPAGSGRSAA